MYWLPCGHKLRQRRHCAPRPAAAIPGGSSTTDTRRQVPSLAAACSSSSAEHGSTLPLCRCRSVSSIAYRGCRGGSPRSQHDLLQRRSRLSFRLARVLQLRQSVDACAELVEADLSGRVTRTIHSNKSPTVSGHAAGSRQATAAQAPRALGERSQTHVFLLAVHKQGSRAFPHTAGPSL